MPEKFVTCFKDENGTDLGAMLVEKSYIANDTQFPQPLWSSQTPAAGVWVTGENASGALGVGTAAAVSLPVYQGNPFWRQIAIGASSVLALSYDRDLWTWGSNSNGQLGDNTTVSKSSPVQLVGGAWKQVATGSGTAAGIKTDGTLWLWGAGGNGQMGDGTTLGRSSPVALGADTNWKQVAVGISSVHGIKTDGTLWSWGDNALGRLGIGGVVDYSSPVQVGSATNWKQVSVEGGSVFGVRTDGSLWGWGTNTSGALGVGDVAQKQTPTRIGASDTDWAVAVGAYNENGAAIKCDGTLWIWGLNTYGQLGDGTTIDKSSPVQTSLGGNDWKAIDLGISLSAAIKKDGTLWTWGSGANGRLGTNSTLDRSNPVQWATGGTSWQLVSAGFRNLLVQAAVDESKM
jgi:alpha-tubulin suppressor-like RCC1 family protein